MIPKSRYRFSEKIIRRRNTSGCRNQRRFGLGVNAFDHGPQAIRTLRREILTQTDAVEQLERVGIHNLSRALAGIKREQDGDQATHNMSVAVAVEGEGRARGAVRLNVCEQPDLAGTAAQ